MPETLEEYRKRLYEALTREPAPVVMHRNEYAIFQRLTNCPSRISAEELTAAEMEADILASLD